MAQITDLPPEILRLILQRFKIAKPEHTDASAFDALRVCKLWGIRLLEPFQGGTGDVMWEQAVEKMKKAEIAYWRYEEMKREMEREGGVDSVWKRWRAFTRGNDTSGAPYDGFGRWSRRML
ncbi:hypothetical protein PMZ80_001062 [Knufia obscura]|uniref:Uncharacterized protein n=2 Tax=Knufia TaxID=430999 RepID=A0AAN8FHN4_9EURO|nr:hypothetical protein PMZ80_001062 [Knufia obscura]KAK5958871.1 hypothetical protein OHC33_000715 [Knufia fluminis]